MLNRSLIVGIVILSALAPAPALAGAPQASSMPADLQDAFFAATSQPFQRNGASYVTKHEDLSYSLLPTGLQAQTYGVNWSISLRDIGRGSDVYPVAAPEIVQTESRLEYRRGRMTEWYRDLSMGVEQGFTIAEAPRGNGNLVLHLDLQTDLPGRLDADERGLSFISEGSTLRYDHLLAYDANGVGLAAWLVYDPAQIVIQVEDRAAQYPITVDPSITLALYDKVVASDGAIGDEFGQAVAISGDTALVGARYADVGANADQGAAYVFTRSAGSWTFAAKLTASDGAEGDALGWSVALSGDTALVGAPGGNVGDGAAYIFVKPGGGWATGTETAKLTASDPVQYDNLGFSVALSDDTALVGVPYADIVPLFHDHGSVYVFVKPGGGWATGTETGKLTASDGSGWRFAPGPEDYFGWSVALSGDTVLVGAPHDTVGNVGNGSAYVFVKPGGGWATGTETAKLIASETTGSFGSSVALSGDTALVGAPNTTFFAGSAYVFVRPGGGWVPISETAKLTASDVGASFGHSVALLDNKALVGVPNNSGRGASYLFLKPAGGWATDTETRRFYPAYGESGHHFGYSVALSDDAALMGAPGDDYAQGSAYFYQPYADLDVSAYINKAVAVPGEAVDLFVSVQNYGPSLSAFDLEVDAPLPTGLTYVYHNLPHGGSYDPVTGVWSIGSMSIGTGTSLAIQATVDPSPPSLVTFTASLNWSDLNSANNSASDDLTVVTEPFATTTTITSDLPDPSYSGTYITVYYTVTNGGGSFSPTGAVDVLDNGVVVCNNYALEGSGSSASGVCQPTISGAGLHNLSAEYEPWGEAFLASSDPAESHTVIPATTTTITSDLPDPSNSGESITVNFSVASESGSPAGTVDVLDGVIVICNDVPLDDASRGSCASSLTGAGVHTLSAAFTPTDPGAMGPSSDTESHVVIDGTTTTITSDLPDPSASGASIVVNYSVTNDNVSGPVPSGYVRVLDGGTVLCDWVLLGEAGLGSCTSSLTGAGVHTLTAEFEPIGTYPPTFLPSTDTESHTVLVDEITGECGFTDVGNPNSFCWSLQSGATLYQVVRSDQPSFPAGCAVYTTSANCVSDPDVPPRGVGYYYLVRALEPNPGSWGADSSGNERIGICGL